MVLKTKKVKYIQKMYIKFLQIFSTFKNIYLIQKMYIKFLNIFFNFPENFVFFINMAKILSTQTNVKKCFKNFHALLPSRVFSRRPSRFVLLSHTNMQQLAKAIQNTYMYVLSSVLPQREYL